MVLLCLPFGMFNGRKIDERRIGCEKGSVLD
jgi:hypothetical protein